jgi:hypothetical protein
MWIFLKADYGNVPRGTKVSEDNVAAVFAVVQEDHEETLRYRLTKNLCTLDDYGTKKRTKVF